MYVPISWTLHFLRTMQPQLVTVAARQNFNKRGQLICGSLQIVLGCLAIILEGFSIYQEAGGFIVFIGSGFYYGSLMLVAGGLGVGSTKSGKICPIIGCLVMSIISALAGLAYAGISVQGFETDWQHRQRRLGLLPYSGRRRWRRPQNPDAAIAVDFFATLVGVTEFCVAIAQIVICSKTKFATHPPPQPQVIFIQQPYPGQAAVVIPPTGYAPQPSETKPT